jgi:ribosomal protein S18 acetylase RimI-like enzyme
MNVEEIADPAEKSRICELVLRTLPQWFGIEQAVQRYVRTSAELPMLAVRNGVDAAGFLSLKRHAPAAAELYLMGVRPELHGRGIGTALVEEAELQLAGDGVEYVQVKTLGPSRLSRGYEQTRRFYEARGFRALEEIPGYWDEDNPCLIMVKRI